MPEQISQDTLNAYVDGELPAALAAQISDALLYDRALAQRVAAIHRLKAASAQAFDDIALPQLPTPAAPARRGRKAVAAALAGLVALGGALWTPPPAPIPDLAKVIAASPQQAHAVWLHASIPGDRPAHPDGFDWIAEITRASGLELVHLSGWRSGGMHLGYLGSNACRLSLFIQPEAGANTTLDMHLDDQLQQARWVTSGLRFDLIAHDMDTARFATIATTAHQKSRDNLPANAAQIALINAARLPCLA
ncbi:MAG: hypothetical protein JJT99_05595 [Rhodobacteraceae bacterium]|nr:hypothetical protein [Paracoccaceae bacterium]